MNQVVELMLSKYECHNENDYINAVREIMQELALQGLWRAKFFEQAAFYGGTALRILYGLPRGSEDMDFSLIATNPDFRLFFFEDALKRELAAYGFDVEFVHKDKVSKLNIDSAFLKANTKKELINVGIPSALGNRIYSKSEIKIKLEIDIEPPPDFQTEVKTLLRPMPHSVRTYTLPCLLAGKLHAVLCRKWRNRSKGRDWYDMTWYAGNHPMVNLKHLETRMRQSGDYPVEEHLTIDLLRDFLMQAIDKADMEMLKSDVRPFLKNEDDLSLWSKDFFAEVARQFTTAK